MATIRSGDRVMATGAVFEQAARAASGFESLGVSRGDAVALMLRNDFPFLAASIGAGLIGAYPVPLNWHSTQDEARYLLENCAAKTVVIHADLFQSLRPAIPESVAALVVPTPPEIRAAYGLANDAGARGEALDWEAWLSQFPPAAAREIQPPGTMIYTSGTTGRPKGVRRAAPSPEQMAMSGRIAAMGFGFAPWLDQPERIVAAVVGPMYHTAPNGYALYSTRIGSNVILEPRFDAEGFLATVERYGVTHVHMVPVMFNRLLKLPAAVRLRYDLSSLRSVVHAAAPVSPEVKHELIGWLGPIICEYYGATETGLVTFCDSEEWLGHPGTVGKPIPEADVRILDEEGRVLGAGETGEVAARLRAGVDFTYHGDEQKRRESEKGGLIATGDIGYFDNDGFLYLCDRANDMVISGGVNIYPAEVEAQLQSMPGVADCAVFGIPDDEFGESVCAVIQPQEGETLTAQEVRGFLRGKIAAYKIPRRIDFSSELPREDSGKIFKRRLRETYWQGRDRRIN